jgi:hypothetical protein
LLLAACSQIPVSWFGRAWVPFVGSVVGCIMVVVVAVTDAPNNPQIAYDAIVAFIRW